MGALVTLVAANYNCDKYISAFIESVIAQTYQDWELFIVDDGSTDNSKNIVDSYSKIDQRISLVCREQEPKGANHCRNIGLSMAKGKYICFFDSDDLLPKYAIEQRVQEIDKSPEMDFIVFPAITFKNVPYDYNELALGVDGQYDDVAMFLRRYRLPFAVWTNIYRLDFFKRSGICWDNSLMSMQDSDLNLTILKGEVKYRFSDDKRPSYLWRKIDNGGNITSTIKSVKNIESQLYFFNKLHNNFGNTKYAKDLSCFKLTLLHRTIHLNYLDKPTPLLCDKCDNFKYGILRRVMPMLGIKNERMSYLLFMMFFPIRLIQELIYRYKNNKNVRLYFNKILK